MILIFYPKVQSISVKAKVELTKTLHQLKYLLIRKLFIIAYFPIYSDEGQLIEVLEKD